MTAATPPEQVDPKSLLEHAEKIRHALELSEQRTARLRDERTRSMSALHDAGISWAEISRAYGVTPQAAMYATGHAKRQAKKKP